MSEDAQATYERLLKDVVAPTLRGHGLTGSGQTFVLPNTTYWIQIGFQKSQSSTKNLVKFTVNLKVTNKAWWDQERREHSYLKDTPPPGVERQLWDAKRLDESYYPPRPSATTMGEGRSQRLGNLIPSFKADHWWKLSVRNADDVIVDALNAVIAYGLPWLRSEAEAATDQGA